MSKVHKFFEVIVGERKPYHMEIQGANAISYALSGSAPEEELMEKRLELDRLINEESILLRKKAEAEYQRMIQEARDEADALLEAAREEAEAARKSAWQEGYSEGKDAGCHEALNKQKEMLERAQGILEQVKEEREKAMLRMEKEVLELALDIAERILQYELDRSEKAFHEILKNAFNRIMAEGNITLRVSPFEYDIACKFRDSWALKSGGRKTFDVVMDNSLEKGGCIVESASGTIDAGIQSQLETIRESFQRLAGNGV